MCKGIIVKKKFKILFYFIPIPIITKHCNENK